MAQSSKSEQNLTRTLPLAATSLLSPATLLESHMTLPPYRTESAAFDASIDGEAVWREHERWIRTVVASRVGERDAVDDVVQQVGLAFVQADKPPVDDQVGPWLYRVAVRQCLLHRRTAGRRRRLLEAVSQQPGWSDREEAAPLDWLLREERLDIAGRMLAELPELDRQLLLLKHTENWTYQQLANHLGVSLDAVEYRLLRARHRLRQMLAQSGIVEAQS